MEKRYKLILSFAIVVLSQAVFIQGVVRAESSNNGELYAAPDGSQTRWVSFENQSGEVGEGGKENKGAKGHAYDRINAGESKVMLNVKGAGIVRRMWFTIKERSPEMLRSLKLEMFWDNAKKPAVSVPFGDFFGVGLGRTPANETAFFSNPEGRSFNASIPMPFKTAAKIVITNESKEDLTMIFYDINYTLSPKADEQALYFHAYWNRELRTTPGKDFDILPKVEGTGRYIGCNIGVNANEAYKESWWGEGEVKMYMDGDKDHPTLVGSGTEDYIGTAWGQGFFNHRYQGCLVADSEKKQWSFYRYHVKDPIYFYKNFRATIQQMGGASKSQVISFVESGINMIPVTIQTEGETSNTVVPLRDTPNTKLTDPDLIDGWTNYYREDDVSATAYFYLDKPENNLPDLADVEDRAAAMR